MAFWLPRWLRKIFRDSQHWEDLQFFRDVALFYGMTAIQLGRLMQAMQKRIYRAGEPLFTEGQIGRAVFIIRSGQVELTKKNTSNKSVRLGILNAGQIFGEMALLENRPRTASAVVAQDSVIYLLYTATLETLIHRYPQIGLKLMRNMAVMLSALLRRTNEQMISK